MADVWDPFGNSVAGKDQSRVGGDNGSHKETAPENYSYQWWTEEGAPAGSGNQSRIFNAETKSHALKQSAAGQEAAKSLQGMTAAEKAAAAVLGTASGTIKGAFAPARSLGLTGIAASKAKQAAAPAPMPAAAASKGKSSVQARPSAASANPKVASGIRAGLSQETAEQRAGGTTSDGNPIGSDPNGYGNFTNSGNGYADYGLSPRDAAMEQAARDRGDGGGASYGTGSASDQSSSGGGGCFITTAAMRGFEPDDGQTLTSLRWFRDNVMRKSAWVDDIKAYYKTAPEIVARINAKPTANRIYDVIRRRVLAPCVAAIEAGRYEEAYHRYRRMMVFLAKI